MAENSREKQLREMLCDGIKAQWERLDDPKNAIKGIFPESIGDVVDFIEEEYIELFIEIEKSPFRYERIREEAADLKNYLDNLILICNKEIVKSKEKSV
jgi:NTP pyrophosphatase (non-canonical NTP hydrolase)